MDMTRAPGHCRQLRCAPCPRLRVAHVSPVSRGRKKKRPTAPPRAAWLGHCQPLRPTPTLSRSQCLQAYAGGPCRRVARYAIDEPGAGATADPHIHAHLQTAGHWIHLGGDWGPLPGTNTRPSVARSTGIRRIPTGRETAATPLTPTRLSEDRDGQAVGFERCRSRSAPARCWANCLSYPGHGLGGWAMPTRSSPWRASEPGRPRNGGTDPLRAAGRAGLYGRCPSGVGRRRSGGIISEAGGR